MTAPASVGSLQIGEPAPALELTDQHGEQFRLTAFQGQGAVLLVFFPFAFSGICSGELTEIKGELSTFADAGVQVAGVSCDPMFSLRAWGEQAGYDFPLLSDFWPHGEVARRYGVFDADRGMAIRGSFLIDRDGVLRWSVVNAPGEARNLSDYRDAVAAL